MKFILTILPFLGALAVAQDLTSKCECPQVKCRADDPVALCQCLNGAETLCKKRCPDYIPKYKPCPVKPTVAPTPTPSPPKCECEQVFCTQQWPDSCFCANDAKQKCYEKCGGVKPTAQICSTDDVKARAPEPEPVPEPEAAKACECDQVMCAQLWPESCYCANAAAESCYKKCGGKKPTPKSCPPQSSNTLTTKATPTPTPKPTGTHKVCGGGRANNIQCDEGYICIADPFSPGCGPACDGLGICVKNKMCGGFAVLKCSEAGQVCVDDPRDTCDPKSGGADCGGLCVWPH